MSTAFYNTTKEVNPQLELFNEKASTQEKKVLSLMNQKKKASPSELLEYFENTPITSIRRALTNLSNKGKLIKTDEKKIGIFGRNEYVWELV